MRSPLLDFLTFRRMISREIMQGVYLVGLLIFCVLGGAALVQNNILPGLLWLIGANLLWRVGCEQIILFFSIHAALVDMERALTQQP